MFKINKAEAMWEILWFLFRYRRLEAEDACANRPCAFCYQLHLSCIRNAFEQNRPIHCVLPGFPAKSPSLQKVLGPLPDTADQLALAFLQSLCDRVREFYSPGMLITLCSDGRIFSDVVGVPDNAVSEYRSGLQKLILAQPSLRLFCLEDVLRSVDYDAMRKRLCSQFASPLEDVKWLVRNNAAELRLFNGIHRFLFEDGLAVWPDQSRNQIRKESKLCAYRVIQRSRAWSRLIAQQFPDALRFSIHPQPAHSNKIGIQLGFLTHDRWLTPWHAVAVRRGQQFFLMKRREAEALGARPVYERGRVMHYEWEAA